MQVGAGPRVVTAAFIKKTSALAESVREPFARPHGEGDYLLYQPHLGTLTVSGPFNTLGAVRHAVAKPHLRLPAG